MPVMPVMSLIWHRATYPIATNPRAYPPLTSGEATRSGLACTLFGICSDWDGSYSVTHLASGKVCGAASTQRGAKSLCASLAAIREINWLLTDPLRQVPDSAREEVRRTIDAWRDK